MPLANALLETPDQLCKKYPLDVWFCNDCTLVQISETVAPEILFSDYAYFSSYSDTVVQNAAELVEHVMWKYEPQTVVEIGSNDGYLLQHYPEDIKILGFEPAENIAKVANAKGISTDASFFTKRVAQILCVMPADIIHANNVLAHVADLNDFVEGIAILLADNGTVIIEVPHVKELVTHCEFDTIYHEHLCYFSISAIHNLLQRHGLHIHAVEPIPIHGGSIRIFAMKRPSSFKIVHDETSLPSYYKGFAEAVVWYRNHFKKFLDDLRHVCGPIVAYGAAAKGAVLLNYCGVGAEILDYIVDRSPHKQGKYMPGVRLPIFPVEMLLEDQPNYCLILAWNHADEIMKQLSEYKGKFIIPIPNVRVV